ncbi:unnamed protein product [Paramecium primaurelia]|uniref:Uncharacterized protein n=1 Tax=Paramecium primaurelia TaxID=5886 RepID=A0A8S1KXH8_PARPR|nr:unnamed protein product [Paramecium primaurelia]
MFVNNSCLPNSMNCIIAPLNGVGGVYLGNLDAAQNSELLSKYQIGAVLSVIDQSIQIRGAQKLWIMADDCEDFPLYKYFDQATKFIDNHSLKTNILIHCYAGISRSAAICAAYMMQKYKWNLNQTLRHIQQRRRFINPNPGFIKQLQDYEQKMKTKQIRKNSSVIMDSNEKSRHNSVGYDGNIMNLNGTNSINKQILNQTMQQNQRDRLSDFNVKLNSYLHQWKIRERAH